jgi:hypothetical protein
VYYTGIHGRASLHYIWLPFVLWFPFLFYGALAHGDSLMRAEGTKGQEEAMRPRLPIVSFRALV